MLVLLEYLTLVTCSNVSRALESPNQKRKRSVLGNNESGASVRAMRTRRANDAARERLEDRDVEDDAQKPRKRRRKSGPDSAQPAEARNVSERAMAGNKRTAKRRKTSSDHESVDTPSEEDSSVRQLRRSKRSRHSGEASGVAGTSNQSPENATLAPRHRTRSRPSLTEEFVQQKAPSNPRKSRRPDAQLDEHHEAPEPPFDKTVSAQRTERRGSSRGQGNIRDAEAQDDPNISFRQLVPRVRAISRETITADWDPLDEGAIAATLAIFSDAERSVLARLRGKRSQDDPARTILAGVSRRLHSKLVKGMPFPPPINAARSTAAATRSAHEDDLDFEKTVDSIQTLEDQLNPLFDAVALLKRELKKEEEELERDFTSLSTLETNARSEARSLRERVKRSHVLAPELGTTRDERNNLYTTIGTPSTARGRVFQVC